MRGGEGLPGLFDLIVAADSPIGRGPDVAILALQQRTHIGVREPLCSGEWLPGLLEFVIAAYSSIRAGPNSAILLDQHSYGVARQPIVRREGLPAFAVITVHTSI